MQFYPDVLDEPRTKFEFVRTVFHHKLTVTSLIDFIFCFQLQVVDNWVLCANVSPPQPYAGSLCLLSFPLSEVWQVSLCLWQGPLYSALCHWGIPSCTDWGYYILLVVWVLAVVSDGCIVTSPWNAFAESQLRNWNPMRAQGTPGDLHLSIGSLASLASCPDTKHQFSRRNKEVSSLLWSGKTEWADTKTRSKHGAIYMTKSNPVLYIQDKKKNNIVVIFCFIDFYEFTYFSKGLGYYRKKENHFKCNFFFTFNYVLFTLAF